MAIFLNRQKEGVNILEMCLVVVVVSLPFDVLINSYSIALFSILSLFSNSFSKKWKNLTKNRNYCLWPIAYFAWMAIRLYMDKSPSHPTSTLETGFSLLVFPLILGSIEKMNPQSIRRILIAFVMANIVGSVICLWKAYLAYKESDYINLFFYHHLSNHIGISAIYFSMYCLFSVYILLYYFLLKKKELWVRMISIFFIGYLSVFIMLLSSKTFIFLLYISALAVIIYSFYYLKYKLSASIMFLLLLAIPFLLIKFTYVTERVRDTQLKRYTGASDNQNGIAVRSVLWQSSWNLIRQRPVLGWGHFAAGYVLQEQYWLKGFDEGVKENYNSHNQYLFTWLCYGIVGLAIMFLFLGQLMKSFIQRKDFLGICIVMMFVLANITECMLETHKGIVFFLLFSTLILFHLSREPSKSGSK